MKAGRHLVVGSILHRAGAGPVEEKNHPASSPAAEEVPARGLADAGGGTEAGIITADRKGNLFPRLARAAHAAAGTTAPRDHLPNEVGRRQRRERSQG